MKHVAIVSPHFVPSNLAGVHRTRLFAPYLPQNGWETTIITVDERHYEERTDPELALLLPEGLRIRKAAAFGTRPLRLVGDIGIRGFAGMWKEIRTLHAEKPIDLLLITIPSNYAAMLGPLAHMRLKIPYGIDYQDPWVADWPAARVPLSKAWFSMKLARILEPIAVRRACLITGVAPAYYEGVLKRNPHLQRQAVTAAMPIGWSEEDYTRVRGNKVLQLFAAEPGAFHMIYAGAMLPNAYPVLESLLSALSKLTRADPLAAHSLRLHFLGTGRSSDDTKGHNIEPFIRKYGLSSIVSEKPERVSYAEVLRHFAGASAILILGSPERHYTPSKVFIAVPSGKPVLALLHSESTAVEMIRSAGAGRVVTFDQNKPISEDEIADAVRDLMRKEPHRPDLDAFAAYSAKQGAKILASAMDEAVRRGGR